MNRTDLKYYTPLKWYYNIYSKGGHLVLSYGYAKKEMAEMLRDNVEEITQQMIKIGAAKPNPNIQHIVVEEAIGWKVGDETFSDYHEALWYTWNNNNQKIEGIFKKD